ncbi:glutamine synthetase family protein [Mesorhizobium sp.]|uniref:glutamine synthetase family protein n=1 Tax=Mesorhizobium sp. TaxID=1871066 RepID=UPI000FEA33C3|nr:glutamine synthetase family protein [Mesorhizobium sp.]RWG00852.1 MAG: glutamine synthetase [Mesorhizobium sp.]RWG96589.1 MAG: glutamine synthetase [Mesorhizobium sp.]TIN48736.1 MAG: glutamine synthetase [Mesorhizobium sp.]TIR91643.1 MAG: glutamine synthetase [Mesorhizobium sp.]TIS04510.1 MAG: glutamine synthetase [Mesorhizobium sp.]
MIAEEMIVACCTDLAGKVRGKAFPATQFDKRMKRGIGWTPTNVQITCFDTIAESPFGSLGDLVLIPDERAKVRVDFADDAPVEHFALGDIHYTDGRPWEFCTRSILKGALERLEKVAGLTLFGAFEHEFQFRNHATPLGDAYSLNGFRAERRLAQTLVAAMRAAGLEPDTFMKEFGRGQYEVTMGPSRGVAIADHSTILRELVRSVSGASGKEVTFTPIRDPAGVGNGVHVHLSFLRNDNPATWDPKGKNELSQAAGHFVAGILKYLDAIVAITAPSVVSYLRLTPHRWSAAFNNLGYRDREAAVRICPVSDMSDIAKAAQFNFEFRAADATASPHLQLAAIVHAGVQGIEEELPAPDATAEDLALLGAQELASRGYVRLPTTLADALERFRTNPTVTGWFPAGFAEVYVKHKNGEMAFLEGKAKDQICSLYEQVY